MKSFNVKEAVKDISQYDEQSSLKHYGGAVAREVEKVKVKYAFKTREHKFSDGEVGEVSNKIDIEIDFGDVVIQPHSDFEGGLIHVVVKYLADEVSGLIENQE